MQKDCELTTLFLRAISDRLSGRKDCKWLEYVVCIGMNDNTVEHQMNITEYGDISNKVFFYPERTVYLDRHHKQPSDLRDIVVLILEKYFKDTILDDVDECRQACFKEGSLVRGIYKYELSVNKRQRHWVRIK